MATPDHVSTLTGAYKDIRTLIDQELTDIWNKLPLQDYQGVKDAMQTVMPALIDKYGSTASVIAGDWYENLRVDMGVPGNFMAVLADTADAEAIQVSTDWAMGAMYDGNPDIARKNLVSVVTRYSLGQAQDTIINSSLADPQHPRFARVPQGRDTCQFCMMLASRGFVYASGGTAGQMKHFHDSCDCKVVPDWSKSPSLKGYDPKKYTTKA